MPWQTWRDERSQLINLCGLQIFLKPVFVSPPAAGEAPGPVGFADSFGVSLHKKIDPPSAGIIHVAARIDGLTQDVKNLRSRG
jgi:hypothetical protein